MRFNDDSTFICGYKQGLSPLFNKGVLSLNKIGILGSKMFYRQAVKNLGNRNKLASILRTSLAMLERNPQSLYNLKDQIRLLISLVKDWIHGDYRQIPKSSIISIVAGLLYLIAPADLFPDMIPLTGLVDDAAVMTYILSTLSNDLEQYRIWKNKSYPNPGIEVDIVSDDHDRYLR